MTGTELLVILERARCTKGKESNTNWRRVDCPGGCVGSIHDDPYEELLPLSLEQIDRHFETCLGRDWLKRLAR
jgi:hypothetical protein